MGSDNMIVVEVAYAKLDQQELLNVEVPDNASLEDAIRHSGVLERFPEIDLTVNKVGIFGKLKTLDEPLRAGDRVEIYRKLIADPKEVRRQRAAQQKSKR